jgi:CRP-like cAMP-binding protein
VVSTEAPAFTGNRILDAISQTERERLVSRMRRRPITPRDTMYEPGDTMREVYFPIVGVISLMTPLLDDHPIETATIGNEGMVGVHAFLGGGPLGNARAVGQVPGSMLVLDADTFRAEANGAGKLRSVMLTYTQALFAQISQSVACNGAHEIQQRTAKWLLETHDRAGGADEFHLTQEYLSEMLGVRRPSVSVAAGTLQNAGLIEYRRGKITVLDRPRLEQASCECYEAVRTEFSRLLGEG